ncbi:TIM barrel protein [Domibacillus robiginosus]|uniref:TIM barrel protein n=1 Tax=Domibacillus robiginosus TaxID=1071054 RepID=UPI00067C9693|nr:TIM barrel protein [Domibacillus robiginosus]
MGKIQMKQIAGMNLHYLNFPFEYFLDSMRSLEIQNIELWGGSPHLFSEDITFKEVGQIRNSIEQRNLKVVCYTPEQCMYPYNLAAKEPIIWRRSLSYFMKNIEIATALGTNRMLITSGKGYYNEPFEEAWKRSKESLSILAEKAEQSGVCLLLEPLQPFESNLVTNVNQVKQMLLGINSPFLKGNVDTVAMAVAGNTLEDYFNVLGSDLIHIHLIDGNSSGHLAWGDGSLPLSHYIEAMEYFDYEGYLTLEIVNPRYYFEPEEALKKSLVEINKIILLNNKIR